MSENDKFDLSRLRIQRDEGPAAGAPPRRKTFALIGYAAGVMFLLVAGLFFYKSVLASEEIVELTTVSMVSPSQASSLLTASGYVVAQRKAAVASKATGRIVELNFKEGDKVKKGAIIARVESEDVEAAWSQASADLAVAKAERDEAQRILERSEQLVQRQLISQAEYDAARSRFDRVVASIASREAALRAAQVQIENTRIRAPFDGTILTKNADVGEVVAPFAAGASSRVAVVTIADMNSLEVETDVSEQNIERISAGQPCEITLDAYPDHRYRGVVDKIVPTADRAKATVLTKVRFLERDNRVLPEMSAKVHFLPNDTPVDTVLPDPKLAVDARAVTTRDGKKVAYLMRDNTAIEREVALGDVMGTLVEIRNGLISGDKVILNPSEKIHNGAAVKLKD